MNDPRASQLAAYIQSLPDFVFVTPSGSYEHMGATITDAILQSGLNYERTVRPRVEQLRRTHPQANTTSSFRVLLASADPYELLNLRGRKVDWILAVTDFFAERGIEIEADLYSWFVNEPTNVITIQQLRGVKTKTANYFKLLCGISDAVAIDTHLRTFLQTAGVPALNDHDAGAIISAAAGLLKVNSATLDASIWSYQSSRSRR